MKKPPIRTTKSALFVSTLLLCCSGCGDDSSQTNNNNCPERLCNDDGECDPGEECLWCQDCCTTCMLGAGTAHAYIVSEMVVLPRAGIEERIGFDLDGNGSIDNTAGLIARLLPFDRPYNDMVAENVQDGRFILLVRLFADGFPTDDALAVQVLPGDDDPSHDATEDNLSGTGHALLHPDVDPLLHMCGTMNNGELETDPGQVVIPYPYIDPRTGGMVLVPLEAAQVVTEGNADATGLIDVVIGGGISEPTMHDVVLPALAAFLNEIVRQEPDGVVGDFLKQSVDCACENTFEGCETVVNGEGDCACWGEFDGVPDPAEPTNPTELKCNALIHTALRPDIDSDGDCFPDLLSVAVKIRAIPVVIDN